MVKNWSRTKKLKIVLLDSISYFPLIFLWQVVDYKTPEPSIEMIEKSRKYLHCRSYFIDPFRKEDIFHQFSFSLTKHMNGFR